MGKGGEVKGRGREGRRRCEGRREGERGEGQYVFLQ